MTDNMSATKDPEKTADLPPYGPRNADPVTKTPGSHPIETGIGAAIGGAASGFAVGMAVGPAGAIAGTIIGAAAGAIAGGYAGKGIGELIDPTTKDNWLREFFGKKHAVDTTPSVSPDTYRPAYDYGVASVERYEEVRRFDDVEPELRADWDKTRGPSSLDWDTARGAVRDAYDRTSDFRSRKQSGADTKPM